MTRPARIAHALTIHGHRHEVVRANGEPGRYYLLHVPDAELPGFRVGSALHAVPRRAFFAQLRGLVESGRCICTVRAERSRPSIRWEWDEDGQTWNGEDAVGRTYEVEFEPRGDEWTVRMRHPQFGQVRVWGAADEDAGKRLAEGWSVPDHA